MMDCPYKGLIPFEKEDEDFFAGREREIKLTITSLYGAPLTVLYGESGVGKTSLIRAGVLPELGKSGHRVATILFRDWQLPTFEASLRDEMLKALLLSINQLKTNSSDPTLLEFDQLRAKFCEALELKTVAELYTYPLDQFIKECSAAFQGRLFFIFDQFEEYIYYHPLKLDGTRFDAAFARAVNDRSASGSFLVALREDGLGKLDRLRGRIPDLLGNLLRIDHLSRAGAEQAITKPLKKYSQDNKVIAEASTDLIGALLEQTNTERLEMDEVSDDKIDDGPEPDSGIRYKAVALQAILTRLWEKKVGRAPTSDSVRELDVKLSLADFESLAQGKKNHETEARFIIRTYFDERLSLLTELDVEHAVEILRGLVRAGGHKRARTAEALSREAAIPNAVVEGLLQKLSSPPINLLRQLRLGNTIQYELHHDVMAFALMDWSSRQREQIQLEKQRKEFAAAEALRQATLENQQEKLAAAEKLREEQLKRQQAEIAAATKLHDEKLQRQASEFIAAEKLRAQALKYRTFYRATAAIAAVALVAFLAWRHLMMQKINFEVENRRVQVLVRSAYTYLGLQKAEGITPNRELGMLTAVDTVATCRKAGIFVSPRYAFALAFATAWTKSGAPNPARIITTQVSMSLPAVENADGTSMLAKTKDSVVFMKSDGGIRDLHLPGSVESMGFNDEGTRYGVTIEKQKPMTWTTDDSSKAQPAEKSLAEALGIKPDGSAPWYKEAVKGDPWKTDYDSILNLNLKDGISSIMHGYGDQRSKAGVVQKVFSDDVVNAYDNVIKRDLSDSAISEATALLRKAFAEVKLESDATTVQKILASNLFNRVTTATGQQQAVDQERYFEKARALDRDIGATIDEFTARNAATQKAQQAKDWMEKGNDFARAGNEEKAIDAYQQAIILDPDLKRSVDPQTEVKKFVNQDRERRQAEAKKLIEKGNEFARSHNRDDAIGAYQKAKETDPELKIDPEMEWRKLAPPPSPPGTEAPPNSP